MPYDDLPERAESLVEGDPDIPLDAPRPRRSFPIRELWRDGRRYVGLRLETDDDYEEAYRRPGQYVTLAPEQIDPRFLVVSNSPEQVRDEGFEFLVDRDTELGRSIDPLEPGTTIEVSPPEGTGFPVDSVSGRDVLCFVTGSGIASIRPALQYWRDRPNSAPASVAVYYGETHPEDEAYTEEVDEWHRWGVDLFQCHESVGEGDEGFQYVQHAFDSHAPSLDDVAVFVSGAPVMKRIVVERLYRDGVPLDQFATNV